MDDSDEERSWSFVDEQEAKDQIPGASANRQDGATELDAILAEQGNDSPARHAELEAVSETSSHPHQQEQTSSSSASPLAPAPQDLEAADTASDKSDTSTALQSSTDEPHHSDTEEVLQQHEKPSQVISGGDSSTSDSLYAPNDLPPVHTATDYADYSYSEEDDMSQSSSNTAVMVENPCSDEEQSNAERRWRLGMQRQDDIRRAQAPPCPRAEGTERFLKVIVVGEAGLGKSTFIQNLQSAFQPELPSPRAPPPQPENANLYEVFKHSPEQLCTEVTINTDVSRFHYLLQDTPGLVYGQTNVRVPAHISKQNRKYLEREQDPQRTQPMSATPDHRVDACLFFLNPNHLKDAEVTAMIQISELVPVVPMIAKADIFTPTELAAFRLLVQRRMADEEEQLGRPIIWQPTPGATPAGPEEEEERCLQPPFAVIASNHTDLAVGRFWPVRTYPWGRCEALSSTNSDLPLLKRLLFEEGFAKLKQDTEERYYKFRSAHLTEAAAWPVDAAAAEGDEAQGDSEWEVEADGAELESDSEDAIYDTSNAQRRTGGNRPGERRSHRNFWMWGMVLTGLLCTALIGNVSQLKADKRALQHKLNMKEQDTLHMDTSKSAPQEEHPKHVNKDKKRTGSGGGSACTTLISAWRHSGVPTLKHKRRPSFQSATQNETTDPSAAFQADSISEQMPPSSEAAHLMQGSKGYSNPDQSGQNSTSASIVPYRPVTFYFQSQQVLQHVEQAVTTMSSLVSSAAANSLAVVQHGGQHAAACAVAASKAVARFLHSAAEQSHSIGSHTSLIVYRGVSTGWAAVVQRLGTIRHAVLRGQEVLAEGVSTFSHDVAEVSRVMMRDVPAVAERMRQDVATAAESANRVVKHLCHGVSRKLTAASHQVDQAAQQAVSSMQSSGMRKWNAKMWIRFAARLGLLGAAL